MQIGNFKMLYYIQKVIGLRINRPQESHGKISINKKKSQRFYKNVINING